MIKKHEVKNKRVGVGKKIIREYIATVLILMLSKMKSFRLCCGKPNREISANL